VKAIHVSQTTNGVNQEVPFQIEDWASEYRIPLGLTNNATVFSNKQMIVFLVNVNVSKVTVWWNGSDTATQTPKAYTTTQFADDDTTHGILTNGKLSLVFAAAQYLYVDGFDATSTSWSTFGTTPYLNDNTTSYIRHSINIQRMGWFTFEDLSNAQTLASAAIKSVIVEFDCKRDGSDDYFDFRVNDGTTTYGPYNITNLPSDYDWRQYDISSIVTDWSKIDTLKIDVGYKQQGNSSSNVYVRRARLSIDFGGWLTSVASNTTAKADFLRVNDESPTYGAGLAYVIHHGVIRDIVQQEAEWSSGISEILYVDSFDNTNLQWTETEPSPYLNNSDSNYISTNGNNNIEGWFGFQNLSINSCAGLKIEFECRDSDPNSDDYFEFQITDGVSTYGWYEIKNLPDSYGWRSYDLSGIITSVAQLNNMKISIRYRQVGSSASTIDIRRSRVDVVTVPNVYSQIVLTLPANASYYTYQLRLMFLNSQQNRTITDLCPIKLSTTSIDQLQTENGTINGIPIVANGTGSFYNFSSGGWTAHHWSQLISGSQGAGIMFTNASNQQLYVFDSIAGNSVGALKVDNSTKTIELLPVARYSANFNYALDVTWHGAVATFDGTATTPIYTMQGTAPTGLWLLVEYQPKITVASES
jgi:hypothetical protein